MDWKENENKLKKTFELGGFSEIIDLLPRLAKIADDLKHHPDFKVHDYKKISFELTTHDSNSITAKDYQLAKEIDQLFLR